MPQRNLTAFKDLTRMGFLDYNDLATATTPIAVGAGGEAKCTNDGLGAFTNKLYTLDDVNDIWDTVAQEFDWTVLELGDMVDIRVDIELITASPNTTCGVHMHLGTGGGAYEIPFITDIDYKDAGSHHVNIYNGIYMGDEDTRLNGGAFYVHSDKATTFKVNGWYCKLIKRMP